MGEIFYLTLMYRRDDDRRGSSRLTSVVSKSGCLRHLAVGRIELLPSPSRH